MNSELKNLEEAEGEATKPETSPIEEALEGEGEATNPLGNEDGTVAIEGLENELNDLEAVEGEATLPEPNALEEAIGGEGEGIQGLEDADNVLEGIEEPEANPVNDVLGAEEGDAFAEGLEEAANELEQEGVFEPEEATGENAVADAFQEALEAEGEANPLEEAGAE
jgi:hypothetical protein